MDIFEKLRDKLDCAYISDIRFGECRDKAVELLKKMQVDSTQKADICQYLGIGVIL